MFSLFYLSVFPRRHDELNFYAVHLHVYTYYHSIIEHMRELLIFYDSKTVLPHTYIVHTILWGIENVVCHVQFGIMNFK